MQEDRHTADIAKRREEMATKTQKRMAEPSRKWPLLLDAVHKATA
jgi:hypothetical protein